MYIAYQVYNSILIFIFMYYHHYYYLTIKNSNNVENFKKLKTISVKSFQRYCNFL